MENGAGSSAPGGPGWWVASDGRWYPPESHPDASPAAPADESLTSGGAHGAAPGPGFPTLFGATADNPFPGFSAAPAAPPGVAGTPIGSIAPGPSAGGWAPASTVPAVRPGSLHAMPARESHGRSPWLGRWLTAVIVVLVLGGVGVTAYVLTRPSSTSGGGPVAPRNRSPDAVVSDFLFNFVNNNYGALQRDILPGSQLSIGSDTPFIWNILTVNTQGSVSSVSFGVCTTQGAACTYGEAGYLRQTLTARQMGAAWFVDISSLPACTGQFGPADIVCSQPSS